MSEPIYFDHAATTPVDGRVLEAMLPFFTEKFGNAASKTHVLGRIAQNAVDHAREQVARSIHADAKDIIWTSGATEANNLAILGVMKPQLAERSHAITQVTEHPAVIDTFREVERLGAEVTWLPVDSNGLVDARQIASAIRPNTVLVSVMAANNELGTIQSISEIGKLCRARHVLFHTDATQAVGKIPIDVNEFQIDLLSLSAHKIYGPKGVGALYIRSRMPRIRIHPLFFGGGHERGMRSGTVNVPGVVGLGVACEIATTCMHEDAIRLSQLRDRLERGLFDRIADVRINAPGSPRLPHITNLSLLGIEAEALLMNLVGIAATTGSACTTMKMEPSHVLKAIGLSDAEIFSSLRFSLGRSNNVSQIDAAIQQISETVTNLKSLNPTISQVKSAVVDSL